MGARDLVEGVFTKLAFVLLARRRRSDFVCADCERVERCGLPPGEDCLVRAMQIARDGGWKRPRRAIEL